MIYKWIKQAGEEAKKKKKRLLSSREKKKKDRQHYKIIFRIERETELKYGRGRGEALKVKKTHQNIFTSNF